MSRSSIIMSVTRRVALGTQYVAPSDMTTCTLRYRLGISFLNEPNVLNSRKRVIPRGESFRSARAARRLSRLRY